jgi:ESX secretion system ATPase EccB
VTQSRKDLFQAHRLMTQRAALALLRGEPDLPDQPLRRLNVATFASVLIAVIIASLFVIFAVLGHGGGQLTLGPGSLIIDQQTGTPYVFCEKAKLCPVENYASARLALRAPSPDQQTVSQDALTRYPRGPLIGIPGLPQPLPSQGLLVRQPWSVCGRTELTASGQRPVTVLAGGVDTGGRPLTHGAVLMQAAGKDWVVWDGQRLYLPPAGVVPMNAHQPVPVSSALLAALPQGPDLVAPPIPGMGTPVNSPIGRTVIGRVYLVPGPGTSGQFYVMLRDGLAQVTQTQARLLEGERKAPVPGRLSLSQVAGHLSAASLPARGLPGHVPQFAHIGTDATICVVYSLTGHAGRTAARLMLGGQMPAGGLTMPAADGISRLVMPPGTGALVGVAPGGATYQGSAISYFLVSGGHRYGLASKAVAGMLGYQLSQKSVLLPLGVAGLIPQGPALDPVAARRPAAASG